jgi:hypothetical protein
MRGPVFARIVNRLETLLFPTTVQELSAPEPLADLITAVLNGRRLTARLDPFTGFGSPPNRF